MNDKIIVTGGSGFIGTNIVSDLMIKGYRVLNLDVEKPKIKEQEQIWKRINILDYEAFHTSVIEFNPDYILHLAARTDLDGKKIEDYAANTAGVENLLKIIKQLPRLKKVIITSSKFVTRNGYQIKNQYDYDPHTVYGESKVITEKKVWADQPDCDWCILRPTSIWGPWFGVPYRDFFDMVMKRMYFHIGHIKCHKTYGYIGNSVYQIEQLLFHPTPDRDNKVFYIGDEPAYEINEWADEIAAELEFKIPTLPALLIKMLAKFGDLLGLLHIRFPMQSFRYGNMTKDGTNDLGNIYSIAPDLPYSRTEGIKATIDWIKNNEGRNRFIPHKKG